MVMQRLSKREKEMKNDPSEFDVINMKSSLTNQYIINKDITMNCPATLNDNSYNDNYNGDNDDDSNYDDDENYNDNNNNNTDRPLGYKLSGYFKEFDITKNESDFMNDDVSQSIPLDNIHTTTDNSSINDKSTSTIFFNLETKNESSTDNLTPITPVVKESLLSSSSPTSTSTADAIEKRSIRKTSIEYIM
jgi:hypothetical protein